MSRVNVANNHLNCKPAMQRGTNNDEKVPEERLKIGETRCSSQSRDSSREPKGSHCGGFRELATLPIVVLK